MATAVLDVLIVGAGLSGVGAACHLVQKCPDKTFAIFEARDAIGGTWDLFRYPGVRSDSDMFTLGYAFKPWREGKAIADGESIRNYIKEAIADYHLADRIHLRHRVIRAEWSSAEALWTVTLEADGQPKTVRARFVFLCSGYYRYDAGYTPDLPGMARFRGPLIHPQKWPADLDYTGKRVVIIGSGATAITLVPAMAERAAHVTMLQRSPTYVVSLPSRDRLADTLRKVLPEKAVYPVVRWKNVAVATLSYQLSRRRPELMKSLLRRGLERLLPAGYDIDKHFTPRYDPWDERLCLVPDADFFKAIKAGRASVVTDAIKTITEDGIDLESGAHLAADIVVTATGLELLAFGGIELVVDGRVVDYAKTIAYKGMMFCGVPNLAYAVGYTNASWTLKVDLVSDFVCRLLLRMDERGARTATPEPPDPSLPTRPFLDLRSGYVARAVDRLPRQGETLPWRLYQNYARDVLLFRFGRIEDGHLTLAD